MLNDDTDRIYLYDSKGLIQCLHEIGLTKPIPHGEVRRQAAEAAENQAPAKRARKNRRGKTGRQERSTREKTGRRSAAQEAEGPAENIKAGNETEKPAPKDKKKAKSWPNDRLRRIIISPRKPIFRKPTVSPRACFIFPGEIFFFPLLDDSAQNP